MRVDKAEPMRGEHVSFVGYDRDYRRHSADNWEERYGESWEAMYECSNQEAAYQAFKTAGEGLMTVDQWERNEERRRWAVETCLKYGFCDDLERMCKRIENYAGCGDFGAANGGGICTVVGPS